MIKNTNQKNNKAITLIALVITIIVLLILAGVTVATITGENGLLSKAQLAKERNVESEQDEKDKLGSYEDEIDNYGTWERTGSTEGTVTITQEEYNKLKNINNYLTTEEKAIGTWIDGSTIYQKTYELETELTVSSNSWTNTNISSAEFSKIISVEAMNSTGTYWGMLSANRDNGSKVQLLNTRNDSITVKYLTLRYIRTETNNN